MRGSTTPYYVEYYLLQKDKITLFVSVSMYAGIAGAVSAFFFTRFICKVTLMKCCAIGIVLTNGALFFVPRESVELALTFTILANFVHMVFTPLLFSTVADTVDYGAKKLGQSAMGMAYSGHLLALKLGLALGGAMTGWVLSGFGYEANVAQSDSALTGILILFSLSSVLAGALVFICMYRYKLSQHYMKETVNAPA
jgi:GPH family glycoside/pentoside/hexuronide:cation symporter